VQPGAFQGARLRRLPFDSDPSLSDSFKPEPPGNTRRIPGFKYLGAYEHEGELTKARGAYEKALAIEPNKPRGCGGNGNQMVGLKIDFRKKNGFLVGTGPQPTGGLHAGSSSRINWSRRASRCPSVWTSS
jgi:hypothetical protein